jgi:apolipoprotein N-acyltransferase
MPQREARGEVDDRPRGASDRRWVAGVPAVLLSAVLHALSFRAPWLAPLAWVALVPLFVACARVRPLGGVAYGLVWSLAYAYGVAWWFPHMATTYFGTSVAAGWVAFFVTAIASSGPYYAAFGG